MTRCKQAKVEHYSQIIFTYRYLWSTKRNFPSILCLDENDLAPSEDAISLSWLNGLMNASSTRALSPSAINFASSKRKDSMKQRLNYLLMIFSGKEGKGLSPISPWLFPMDIALSDSFKVTLSLSTFTKTQFSIWMQGVVFRAVGR